MNNLQDETKYLTKKYGIHPQRKSGQNFLIEEEPLDIIINAAQLKKSDNVLEIGAGFGPLTKRLAEKAKKVWAVELEKRFMPELNKLGTAFPLIEIIHQDILKLDISKLVSGQEYKIVANLPYNITSFILRKFLEQEPKPCAMTLLMQKEVAERVVASVGKLSLLAVSVQFYGKPQIIHGVSRTCFWPEPKVDSAIVKIGNIRTGKQIKERNKADGYDFSEKQFFQVVKAGFSAKRKQIHNNLANSLHVETQKIKKILVESGIKPEFRPQDIAVNSWKKLTFTLNNKKILEK
ncbi:ribosomal RNA small subunit methyltransferase A [Patescibacteria group bacterium]|nr:ribosomal RNA small subunit methyltransferase A [Patescibacteria group bacterium]MBU1952332.1 ribosomal RNA small subunit methyltransferase A [Patescibacteria group bacterium]